MTAPATQYVAITNGVDALAGGPMSLWPWMLPALPVKRGSVARMRRIAEEVAESYGLRLRDLTGLERGPTYAHPRQEAMWRVRQETELSYPRIGEFFNRDHATVLCGCRAHERRQREALLAA